MSDAAPRDPEVSEEPIEGRCLCGAVRVRTRLYRRAVTACYCAMCRRWAGGAFLAFGADAAATDVTGPVRRCASSAFAERASCAECGSILWWHDTRRAEPAYGLSPGLFTAAASFPDARALRRRGPGLPSSRGDHLREARAAYEAAHPEAREIAHD